IKKITTSVYILRNFKQLVPPLTPPIEGKVIELKVFRNLQQLLSKKYYLCALCAFAVNYYPWDKDLVKL
ncbi:MAG: hypothetical protein NUV74_16700, partial [Candidatus Brocadiaceae bacterium]|nr:hypothetical protein [Candidatus Brocadiaceae bacterium]